MKEITIDMVILGVFLLGYFIAFGYGIIKGIKEYFN